MEALKIGIMGTGGIASILADTMLQMPQAVLMGAASRSLEKAEEFAARFSLERAYGSYEELAKDPDIQLIYIATPHSEHYSNAKLCLENGKHVLCEKAFAANYAQAKEMTGLAKEKKSHDNGSHVGALHAHGKDPERGFKLRHYRRAYDPYGKSLLSDC
uniref:Gfo/Idh/MocA family protein n=1 Tax=Clostridium sp. NkU-1 TaxID=1095009 RepID=UPI000A8DBA6A